MDSDSNPNVHAPLLSSFCEITFASRQEALFFLESHNFDLDAAVSSFLDDDNAHHNIIGGTNVGAGDNALPSPADFQHSPSPMPSQPPIDPLSRTTAQGMAPEIPSGGGAGGIRTFSDLKRPAPDSLGYDSDEPQEHNSGDDPKSVDDIFNQARPLAVDGPLQNTATSKSFTGTARSLSGATVSSNPQQPEIITHKITFWRNGFSVDDGPLRRLDDPQNASFLESIKKSECPKELKPANLNATVQVSLARRDDNYPESSGKSRIPFCGIGRTTGSPSSSSDAPAGPNQTTVDSASANTAPTPSMGLVVDDSQPVTSIQLRLADGTRMVSRFNRHHTIRDVRAFIDASRPGGAGVYQLLTMGFPPKQLTDLNQTIDQAGIASSVVIQKV